MKERGRWRLATGVGLAAMVLGSVAVWLLIGVFGRRASAKSPATIRHPTAAQWFTIIGEVESIDNRATVERRPELLREIYDAACSCLSKKGAQIREALIHKGLHADGITDTVLSADRIGSPGSPNGFTVVHEVSGYRLLNAQGEAVSTEKPLLPEAFEEDFVWSDHRGRWMVSRIHWLGSATTVLPGWQRPGNTR